MKNLITKLSPTGHNEGTVNFFSREHGFGFINLKDTKQHIYVHTNHIIDTIEENDRVVFEVIEGVKGLIATKVRKLL